MTEELEMDDALRQEQRIEHEERIGPEGLGRDDTGGDRGHKEDVRQAAEDRPVDHGRRDRDAEHAADDDGAGTDQEPAGEVSVFRVPAHMVVQALRLGADVGLGAVIEQTGDESPDFVFGELVAGRMQLWAISRDGQPIATVITQIEGRPAVRALTLRYMAGKSFSSWAGAAHAAFMAFARETDCALIEATASRRGLGPTFKEFGWRQVAVMFQVAVE